MDDSKRAMEADACWVNIEMNGSPNERHQRWRRGGWEGGFRLGGRGRGGASRGAFILISGTLVTLMCPVYQCDLDTDTILYTSIHLSLHRR